MIYTTYFDNIKNLDKNIIPIAICGKCPDDWTGLKFPKLAPKKGFWNIWEKTRDNDYYVEHYNNEVLSKFESPFDVLDQLYDILPQNIKDYFHIINCPPWEDNAHHIALVCFEKPGEFCHRTLVAKWINNYFGREVVKEYDS